MSTARTDSSSHADAAVSMVSGLLHVNPNRDFPGEQALAIAQVNATLAVWAELKRWNDAQLHWQQGPITGDPDA